LVTPNRAPQATSVPRALRSHLLALQVPITIRSARVMLQIVSHAHLDTTVQMVPFLRASVLQPSFAPTLASRPKVVQAEAFARPDQRPVIPAAHVLTEWLLAPAPLSRCAAQARTRVHTRRAQSHTAQDAECNACSESTFTWECNRNRVILTILGATLGPALLFILSLLIRWCSWRHHRVSVHSHLERHSFRTEGSAECAQSA
jgi:hypothetical protein